LHIIMQEIYPACPFLFLGMLHFMYQFKRSASCSASFGYGNTAVARYIRRYGCLTVVLFSGNKIRRDAGRASLRLPATL
jgi:hypothetical protein